MGMLQALVLLASTLLNIAFGTAYHKLYDMFLFSETFNWMIYVFKCGINRRCGPDRSDARMIVGNWVRCLNYELLLFLICGQATPLRLIGFRMVQIVIVTLWLQYCFNKQTFKKYQLAWTMQELHVIVGFGGLTRAGAIPDLENFLGGAIFPTQLFHILNSGFLFFVDLVEDFYYNGDLGTWKAIQVSNAWLMQFVPIILVQIICFYMIYRGDSQHYGISVDAQGKWRD
jgi:hypothetical protein